jgi:hypothetical protein
MITQFVLANPKARQKREYAGYGLHGGRADTHVWSFGKLFETVLGL